jgi:hypothetical protein
MINNIIFIILFVMAIVFLNIIVYAETNEYDTKYNVLLENNIFDINRNMPIKKVIKPISKPIPKKIQYIKFTGIIINKNNTVSFIDSSLSSKSIELKLNNKILDYELKKISSFFILLEKNKKITRLNVGEKILF